MTIWTDPRTWTIGELVTKAMMDTHVRDNLKHLKEQTNSLAASIAAVAAMPVLLTTPLSNAGYDGDAKNIGTYTMTANAFNAGIPTTARGLYISLGAKWAAASDSNFCNIVTPGIAATCVAVRAQVANFYQDNAGIVPLNASKQFSIVVAGANATSLIVNVWGYF